LPRAETVARAGDREQILHRLYTPPVHPIERLRFVARSTGVPAEILVRETATALGAFRGDHAGLVAACRRVVERQPTCAPLWWLCARMLCAADPSAEARAAVDEIESDPTARAVAAELPERAVVVQLGWPHQVAPALRRRGDLQVLVIDTDGSAAEVVDRLVDVDVDAVEVHPRNVGTAVRGGGVVLIDAFAVGPTEALAPAGSFAAAATATHLGVPVWLVAGAGRLMPASMFDGLARRWGDSADDLDADEELLPLDVVDRVAGIGGVGEVAEALRWTDCPVAPELFGPSG
jgi:hypothetical protein